MKRSIKEMTFDELCQIASIATGGWSSSESSRGHREVELCCDVEAKVEYISFK